MFHCRKHEVHCRKKPTTSSAADNLKKEDQADTREFYKSIAFVYFSWILIIGALAPHLFLPFGLVEGVGLTAVGFLSFFVWRLLVTQFLVG